MKNHLLFNITKLSLEGTPYPDSTKTYTRFHIDTLKKTHNSIPILHTNTQNANTIWGCQMWENNALMTMVFGINLTTFEKENQQTYWRYSLEKFVS